MALSSTRWNVHWLGWLALLLLIPAVFIQVQRVRAALASDLPAVTTGCEEESFYAIWRVNHSLATYPDSAQPPYAAAYFNWLFYQTYSAACARHPDEQIPLRGRILTLLGTAAALVLSAWAMTLGGHRQKWPWVGLAALALFSSSLFGWWLVTVRPDLWALALEIGLVAWFFSFHSRHRGLALGGAIVLAYLAWSFKQSNVTAVASLVVFLFWRRERISAAVAAGGFALMVTMTLLLGDPLYRASLLSAATGFEGRLGWVNLQSAIICALPITLLPVYTLGLWLGDGRKPWNNAAEPIVQFATIGMVISSGLAFVAGFKAGASHNYYFMAAFFTALAGWHSRCALQNRTYRRAGDAMIAAAAVAACFLACLQAGGKLGTLSLTSARAEIAQRLEVWNRLPSPRFTVDRRLALPWLNPGVPLFFPANNYATDRDHHRPFAHGGIGGLMAEGYFAALLLPADTGDYFDGTRISDHYRPTRTVAGVIVYERIDPALRP